MKTVIGNNVFITKFAYKTNSVTLHNGQTVDQRESFCYIKHSTSKNSDEKIIEVSVKNDSRDNFERAIGRTLAFKKALTALFADKSIREKFALGNVEFNQFIRDFYEQCPNSYVL